MQSFVRLYRELERTQSTSRKVEILALYFQENPPKEAVWVLYLFLGRKQKRAVQRRVLQEALAEHRGLEPWLFEECYATVGDLAETIALLQSEPQNRESAPPLSQWMEDILPSLSRQAPEEQKAILQTWWTCYGRDEVYLITKLMTGGLRTGLAKNLLVRALGRAFELAPETIAERLMGDPPLDETWLQNLRSGEGQETISQRPYPFYLASPLEGAPQELGAVTDFAVEWKWDGIRAQLVKRGSHIALWSRGEEWLNDGFPDLIAVAEKIPEDFVLDGEILIEKEGKIQTFAVLQKRIMRKKLSAKILSEDPAVFMAFDCLERGGQDLRSNSQKERRRELEALLSSDIPGFRCSPLLPTNSWDELVRFREEASERGVEGLMLKRWESPYKIGRKRGDWWKWKLDPMTLDAVLIYAQAGHGRRANQYTDYTFALWHEQSLVPFAKAYSGLNHAEIEALDKWIRAHTLQKFGPVRSVEPLRVFEIAFEGIQVSTRHKSGIAVRFPRVLRERTDKKPEEADTLARAKELIHARS